VPRSCPFLDLYFFSLVACSAPPGSCWKDDHRALLCARIRLQVVARGLETKEKKKRQRHWLNLQSEACILYGGGGEGAAARGGGG